LLSRHACPSAAREQAEAVIQTGVQVRDAHTADAYRGHLQREGNAIQFAANLHHR
jgi:hypothetical protein